MNPKPFPQDPTRETLLDNAVSVLEIVKETGYSSGERVAILGHSMGSGVAQSYGIAFPTTSATIAISPIPREIDPDLPRNLLYLAGELEPGFVQNAETLLLSAGGSGGQHTDGTARDLAIVPGVEHITILFATTTHRTVQQWLGQTFESQVEGVAYTDQRMIWLGAGILGSFLIGWAFTPLLNPSPINSGRPKVTWRRRLAPILGASFATLIAWILSRFGIALADLLGLVVGGYLLVWLGVAGSIGLLWTKLDFYPLTWRRLRNGWVAFALLWVGVGLLSHATWVPWLLIPKRLILWPLGTLLSLPWFLIVAGTFRGEGWTGRLGGWLLHSLLLAGAFILSMNLIPGLGVLILVLPLLPVILGLIELVNARFEGSWSYAISGAAFLSWILFAVFPMT
jgi:pimeloyl-ACP methyl ester carboxylesterase